jgi:hypothetical protein
MLFITNLEFETLVSCLDNFALVKVTAYRKKQTLNNLDQFYKPFLST